MKTRSYPNNCVSCGVKLVTYRHKTDGKLHAGQGLCEACYGRARWKINPEWRKKHKKLVYQWRDDNPELWSKIQNKASKKYFKTPQGRLAVTIGYFKHKYGRNWKSKFRTGSKYSAIAVKLGKI